jgi:amino-acid N-acetyltransferase
VSKIYFKKPVLSDIALMQKIVKDEIINGIILNRSDDEVATNIRSYTLALKDNKITGFCALHIYNTNLAEIRSLVVAKDFRNQKIGQKLVKKVLKEAQALGIKQVLVLTYKEQFFRKLNFNIIQKEDIPDHKIWADCIKCKHFPVCDEISLIKYL